MHRLKWAGTPFIAQAGTDSPPIQPFPFQFPFPKVRGQGGVSTLYLNFLRLALIPPVRVLIHNSLLYSSLLNVESFYVAQANFELPILLPYLPTGMCHHIWLALGCILKAERCL